jgi:hypothetical protein
VIGGRSFYRSRRVAVAAWNANAAAARPGQVWTYRYCTRWAVAGGSFTSYVAGPVRILGAECPVPAFRGQKTLGEVDLGLALPEGLLGRWLTTDVRRYSLQRGDFAPVIPDGHRPPWQWLRPTPTALFGLTLGQRVMVEHRSAHPVYAGLRFVEIGRVGYVEDFHDEQGPGRYIGDTWVRMSDVTGAVILHPGFAPRTTTTKEDIR